MWGVLGEGAEEAEEATGAGRGAERKERDGRLCGVVCGFGEEHRRRQLAAAAAVRCKTAQR